MLEDCCLSSPSVPTPAIITETLTNSNRSQAPCKNCFQHVRCQRDNSLLVDVMRQCQVAALIESMIEVVLCIPCGDREISM